MGMGMGATLSLTIVATIREILGSGTWLGIRVMPNSYEPMLVAILAPGAFFTLGFLMALMNRLKEKRS